MRARSVEPSAAPRIGDEIIDVMSERFIAFLDVMGFGAASVGTLSIGYAQWEIIIWALTALCVLPAFYGFFLRPTSYLGKRELQHARSRHTAPLHAA
jgi:hypothetical protein